MKNEETKRTSIILKGDVIDAWDDIKNKSEFATKVINSYLQDEIISVHLPESVMEKYKKYPLKEFLVSNLLTEYFNDNIMIISDFVKANQIQKSLGYTNAQTNSSTISEKNIEIVDSNEVVSSHKEKEDTNSNEVVLSKTEEDMSFNEVVPSKKVEDYSNENINENDDKVTINNINESSTELNIEQPVKNESDSEEDLISSEHKQKVKYSYLFAKR